MAGEDLFQNQRAPWLTVDPTAAGSVTTPPDAGDLRLHVDPTTKVLAWKDSAGATFPLAAQSNFSATAAPGTGDDSGDGYAVGSRWIDVTNDKEYVCLDASVGAAVWTETTATGGGGGGGELDRVEVTGSTSITATTEATANTVVTATGVAFDGATDVDIEAFFPFIEPAASVGAFIVVVLYDGASSIGLLGIARTPAANSHRGTFFGARRLTPSAATHTYSIRAYVSTGTGSVFAGTGGSGNYMPGYIRIVPA